MFNQDYSLSDIAAVTDENRNDGCYLCRQHKADLSPFDPCHCNIKVKP